jgi:hypothetical protein
MDDNFEASESTLMAKHMKTSESVLRLSSTSANLYPVVEHRRHYDEDSAPPCFATTSSSLRDSGRMPAGLELA